MLCADYWFLRANEWETVLKQPSPDAIHYLVKIKKENVPIFTISPSRKRRRQDDSRKLPTLFKKAIIGPDIVRIEEPIDFTQSCTLLVNAMAGILPLDIKINLFGFAHSMILVGVLYKHNNLSWIVLNRMNLKCYLASHFVADALHLFTKHRNNMQFRSDRKWHRQGINEIMTLATDMNARNAKNVTRMNCLPTGVLRFQNTRQNFFELSEFLRCVGSSGSFLTKYTRKQPAPIGFVVPNDHLCQQAVGWKVFKKTQLNQMCKVNCLCHEIPIPYGSSLQESVINLIASVPSSLDRNGTNVFEQHFKVFIDFVRNNPSVSFYPKCNE